MQIALSIPNATLRPVRMDDAADIALCCHDLQLATDVGGAFPHPYTLENGQQFAALPSHALAKPLHLCVTLNNRLVGMMGIVSELGGTKAYAAVGYWMGKHARGQGLAAAGLDAFSQYAFKSFTDINRLEALVFDYNIASMRVLEKAGYMREAVLKGRARTREGNIVDDVMFARLRADRN